MRVIEVLRSSFSEGNTWKPRSVAKNQLALFFSLVKHAKNVSWTVPLMRNSAKPQKKNTHQPSPPVSLPNTHKKNKGHDFTRLPQLAWWKPRIPSFEWFQAKKLQRLWREHYEDQSTPRHRSSPRCGRYTFVPDWRSLKKVWVSMVDFKGDMEKREKRWYRVVLFVLCLAVTSKLPKWEKKNSNPRIIHPEPQRCCIRIGLYRCGPHIKNREPWWSELTKGTTKNPKVQTHWQ